MHCLLFIVLLCALASSMRLLKPSKLKMRATFKKIIASSLVVVTTLFPNSVIAIEKQRSGVPEVVDEKSSRVKLIRASNEFLSNPILEAIRINTQADVDVTKDTDRGLFLIPIVKIDEALKVVERTLSESKPSTASDALQLCSEILSDASGYDTKTLKRTFNRYSDNIFYQDKSEANLYLAGGTTPGSAQTTAYLYRNQIITSLGNIKQDLQEMMSDSSIADKALQEYSEAVKQVFDDTLDDVKDARSYLKNYFDIIDQNDLSRAKAAVKIQLKG